MSVIQLRCDCNNYPWGKTGKDSLAARYAEVTPGFTIKDDTEYAEMWMGTYPTTPSKILSSGEDLQEYLNANKEKLIGKAILDKFGTDLPYLPKILSIAKALPLQIHPDKDLAARLHAKDPSKFGDENHKPEIAVALSEFELFVGFQPLNDIQAFFSSHPFLKDRFFDDPSHTHFNADSLKRLVGRILSASDEEIKQTFKDLRMLPSTAFGTKSHIYGLLPRLAEQYSTSDPGNIVALLTMNYLKLPRGAAVFVPADGIHAYLAGDIIECMARSDNVINTGFCPRADRDSVDLFTMALTYEPKSAEEAMLHPQSSEKGRKGKTLVLAPPMSEFDMLRTELASGEKEEVVGLGGPGILVFTGGSGKLKVKDGEEFDVKEGLVYFVGVDTELAFEAGNEGLEMHLAYTEA